MKVMQKALKVAFCFKYYFVLKFTNHLALEIMLNYFMVDQNRLGCFNKKLAISYLGHLI